MENRDASKRYSPKPSIQGNLRLMENPAVREQHVNDQAVCQKDEESTKKVKLGGVRQGGRPKREWRCFTKMVRATIPKQKVI